MFLGKIHLFAVFRFIFFRCHPERAQNAGFTCRHRGKAPAGPPGTLIFHRSDDTAVPQVELLRERIRDGSPGQFGINITDILAIAHQDIGGSGKLIPQIIKGLLIGGREGAVLACFCKGAGQQGRKQHSSQKKADVFSSHDTI